MLLLLLSFCWKCTNRASTSNSARLSIALMRIVNSILKRSFVIIAFILIRWIFSIFLSLICDYRWSFPLRDPDLPKLHSSPTKKRCILIWICEEFVELQAHSFGAWSDESILNASWEMCQCSVSNFIINRTQFCCVSSSSASSRTSRCHSKNVDPRLKISSNF